MHPKPFLQWIVRWLPDLKYVFCIPDTPELLVTRTDDKYLLRFLRAKYYQTNHAYQLVGTYT